MIVITIGNYSDPLSVVNELSRVILYAIKYYIPSGIAMKKV
jgi:hypothetical protein